MVKVRNESFKIYDIDTLLTFIERLAYKFNTLPKYINIEEKDIKFLLDNPDYNLEYENLLDTLQNKYKSLETFSKFFQDKSEKFNLNVNDLLKVWLYTKREKLQELEDDTISSILIDNQLKSIKKKIPENTLLEYIKNAKRGKLREEIDNEISVFKKTNVKYINDIELLNSLDSKSSTKFEQTKTSYVIEINLEDNNVSSVFDLIQLNEYIPFCSYNNMYKIYKDFTPSIEWDLSLPESILLKLYSSREYRKKVDYDDYLNSLIYKNKNGNINIEIEVSLLPNNLTKEEVTKRLLSVINRQVEIISENSVYISGLLFYPNFYVNKDIFNDMCMNNRIFSKFLSIDESLRATKRKNVIQIYYKDLGKEDTILSATILSKIYEKGDVLIKGRNIVLSQNEPYLRLSIKKAKNIDSIRRFQYLFSKLLTLYTDNKDDVIDFYKKYIINFGKDDKKEIKKNKLTLRDQVPDLFVSNYSRRCPNEPVIIDDEIQKYTDQDYQIMKFPKSEDEGSVHYYICKDKNNEYIYPGLRKNTLENKDRYPFIPCCYKTDQRSKKSYLEYFSGKQKSSKEELTKYIITTDKILKEDVFGLLPININKLLISINDNITYYRKGVTRSKNSFIECVAEVFDEEFKEFGVDDKRIPRFLKNKRKELATSKYIALARQENFNLSIDGISKNILNDENYFDPRLYLSLLEYMYECRIYVFTKNGLLIPNHVENYLQYDEMYDKSILIYEHYGIDADNATYPQCELIVYSKGIPEVEYYIQNYNILYRPLNEFFNQYNRSYSLNKLIIPYVLPNIKIVEQYIDGNGKTRYIKVEYNSRYIYLGTSPLPPLPIPENNNLSDFIKVNNNTLLKDFFDEYDIDIYRQYFENNVLNIQGIFNGNIYFIGLVENFNKLDNIEETKNVLLLNNTDSLLKQFNNNKRISRYLLQNFIWKFSKYIHEKNIQDNLLNIIPDFVNDKINIDREYKYNQNIFSKKFMDDEKLIINSTELLLRLVYNLTLRIKRNPQYILNFYKKQFIENYYYSSTDYILYPTQVLLEGENSVSNWINTNKNKLKFLENKIDVSTNEPYFIKNKLLTDNNINIAQNSYNLLNALSISDTWFRDNYNMNVVEENTVESIEPFDLYIYKNRGNIVKKSIGGGDKYLKIAGYKVEGEPQYTSLLNL